ncbi:BOLA class I histocompatibility antigen, alpha chain BL3-6-like isoform X2 [Hemibagrus wyckioides]|uniref:BOLA class I histocompatibility antigen, alpha chain BL3-6-like isoform X2 n=1 Tax=Hemibagrus wyckioides TaxID=337641 RepID=UPI00266B903D|nr:BOLA class I histocompatibility antigen, alpha chain BL3-6-like isoform X2 [Hemibagrus wyckioides]
MVNFSMKQERSYNPLSINRTPVERVDNTHSLQFFYTAVTPGINFPEFTAVGLVDGEQFVYYDRNIRKMIPKTEWIQKISADDPDYWNRKTEYLQDHQDIMVTVMKNLNQDEGNHTLQWMLGCGLDNGIIRGYSQYRYDGEDFISLDLNWNLGHGHESWTPANDKAKNFLMEWDPKGEKAKYWKEYLSYDCIDQLNKFVLYSKETMKRKVPPTASVFQKHSPSPEVVCNATGFFPEVVNITWRKDGEDVNEDVELRETFPNQDGSFQKRSILKVPAEDLQKHTYTCVIQHSSLKEELVLEVPKGRGSVGTPIGIIIGAVTLIAVVAGVFILKKKKVSGAEQSHEVQQKGTEINPLNTPHSDVPV